MDDNNYSANDLFRLSGSQPELLDSDLSFSPETHDMMTNYLLENGSEFNMGILPEDNDTAAAFASCLPEIDPNVTWTLKVSFEGQPKPVTKSTAWTYSEQLNRLYVNIGHPCPIQIETEPPMIPGFILRSFLRYQKPVYASDPVKQCANHAAKENNLSLKGHVLRCKRIDVKYTVDSPSERYSLVLPHGNLQDGGDKNLYVFEFYCLSTCLGRRAMELVFQVEYCDRVICCHTVNVRICSCPGRDRKHDEIRTPGFSALKVRKRPHADDEVFVIKVKGRKNFDLLMALKERLEKADAYDRESCETEESESIPTKDKRTSVELVKDEPKAHCSQDRTYHYRVTHHSQLQMMPSHSGASGKIRKTRIVPNVADQARPSIILFGDQK